MSSKLNTLKHALDECSKKSKSNSNSDRNQADEFQCSKKLTVTQQTMQTVITINIKYMNKDTDNRLLHVMMARSLSHYILRES